MSSFFNKVFGDSGEGEKKPESHLPKPNESAAGSPFDMAEKKTNADMGHQLFGQLADAEATKSSEPVTPLVSESDQNAHHQGFVRPQKLPVRGFTAGELAALLPPEFINYRSMPAGQEVDLDLTRARQSMASGRPAVMLSDIYAACPRLFARPITADQDFEVRLPMKRVEALLGTTDGGHAGGPLSPFQMSSSAHHPAAEQMAAPTQQSPFSQVGHNQAPPSSPFEVVGSSASQPAAPPQKPVPLFSQPAPEQMLPEEQTARVYPNESSSQPASNELIKLQLGKALRFASVEVLGFSATNVPESVYSEIPAGAIQQRNPNGSATMPLSILVSGLEQVYRSAFNQADMSASVTIPADALPEVSMMAAAPKVETAPVSPINAAQRTMPSVAVESPFAAYANEDAQKHEAASKQNAATDESMRHETPPKSDRAEDSKFRGYSEDTRALRDLSKRLSAFRDQSPGETAPDDNTPVEPVSADQVKPLAPLTRSAAASANDPQPKFRDLQEQEDASDAGEESFIQPTPAPVATPEPEAAPKPKVPEVSVDEDFDEDDEWKQVELKAVFGLEKTLKPKDVFELVLQLDGVRSAAYIEGQETKYSTNGFGDMAPVLGDLIDKIRQLSNEIGIHGAQSFAIQTNCGAVAFFSEGTATLAVMAKSGDISRASKQRIIVILRELVRGY